MTLDDGADGVQDISGRKIIPFCQLGPSCGLRVPLGLHDLMALVPKLEASRRSVRSEVDFVLTFEELMGLFEAKAVNFADLPDNPEDAFNSASADARGFAASGGVAQAVVNAIKKMDPDREVKVMSAQGLADCKKMMMMAKAGKYNGYLLEGMACPGGCIAGAGTLADPAKSVAMLNKYKNEATMKVATETPYQDSLDLLHY